MLIHGMCPEPLNPLIFHFIIHNGDFNSLYQALIQEWHPGLFDLINRSLATAPQDSLEPFREHFASYHNIDVSPAICNLYICLCVLQDICFSGLYD